MPWGRPGLELWLVWIDSKAAQTLGRLHHVQPRRRPVTLTLWPWALSPTRPDLCVTLAARLPYLCLRVLGYKSWATAIPRCVALSSDSAVPSAVP